MSQNTLNALSTSQLLDTSTRPIQNSSQYKMENAVLVGKVICAFICFAEIMMEIMADDTLWVSDSASIYYIQSAFSYVSQVSIYKVAYVIEFWANPLCISAILIALFNSYDPIVAAKTAYITYYALLIRNFAAVLLFQEPRPFWIDSRINGESCINSLTGPSEPMIVAVFAFIYIIRLAYVNQLISKVTMAILIMIFSLNVGALFFFELVIGANFVFQSISGVLIGAVMVIGTISFDKYLTNKIIKLGFIEEKARQQMIIELIKQFIIYLLVYGIVAVLPVDYNIPIDWIRNFKVH